MNLLPFPPPGRRLGRLGLAFAAVLAAGRLPAAVERQADGIIVPVAGAYLKVEVRADNIIRVAFAKDPAFFARRSLSVLEPSPEERAHPPAWSLALGAGSATVSTARLRARVDLATGAVSFLDRAGRTIEAEAPGGRELAAAVVQGERTFHIRQQWKPHSDESLYGLGQQQLGFVDIKGRDLDLWQHNTTVAVPFLVSSRGYGIFWDNPSYTRFGDLRLVRPIPSGCLVDADGRPGALTASYYRDARFGGPALRRRDAAVDHEPGFVTPLPGNGYIDPSLPPGEASVRWEGEIVPPTSGTATFQARFSGGLKLWLDGRLVMDHWRQEWLPWIEEARVKVEAGRPVRARLDWTKDVPGALVSLGWKPPPSDPATSLWSEVGDGIDYDFVYGPDLDTVVAGYRRLTGRVPMMPIWAFGLWQSRQRYHTQKELLGVLAGYRARRIPIDVIVQDWFYWKEDAWGSHEFDPARYPDPDAMIREIHDRYHARLMISIWPKFYPGTADFQALRSRGMLYEPTLREGLRDWLGHPYAFYDAFNPAARKLYWSQVDRALFRRGVDAWWLDASEPDLLARPSLPGTQSHMNPTALGPGSRVLNAYPLAHTEAVYDGQRASAPDRRVFILTRSAFAGQQRNAAATWSGDISSTWTAMRKQIAAGLGFSISGIPYWTMDVGGFSVPPRWSRPHPSAADLEEWRELNARWFEFGAFVPILRVHGEAPDREMWKFGGESGPAYRAELKFDRLRYRLLPYIYSLAGAAALDGGTIMRPLVMDFRSDPAARAVADQYLFGPAFLVSPVTAYRARSRPVYLPAPAYWYDLWTGAALTGGAVVEAAAPYDAIPIHVRAGSIVPFGPDLQYATERPADPITLFVYSGADGAFTLYEDDGLTYACERGAFTRIRLDWNDDARTLRIGARQGAYPGMPARRTFRIVFVSPRRPVPFSFDPKADRTVRYDGTPAAVRLP